MFGWVRALAWMTACVPSELLWRSQRPVLVRAIESDWPLSSWESSFWKAACIFEATGLKMVTPKAPIARAITIAGVRNCQTETPAARATISSWLRVIRHKARMAPSRTAKGRTSSAVWGSCNPAILDNMPRLTPS